MNNEQLIVNIAMEAGLYTEDEIENFLKTYGEIPLHSLQGWKQRSPAGYEYRVKKGEHGIETRLWKKRKRKLLDENSDENISKSEVTSRDFYLAKTFLFDESQIELVKKGDDNGKS